MGNTGSIYTLLIVQVVIYQIYICTKIKVRSYGHMVIWLVYTDCGNSDPWVILVEYIDCANSNLSDLYLYLNQGKMGTCRCTLIDCTNSDRWVILVVYIFYANSNLSVLYLYQNQGKIGTGRCTLIVRIVILSTILLCSLVYFVCVDGYLSSSIYLILFVNECKWNFIIYKAGWDLSFICIATGYWKYN